MKKNILLYNFLIIFNFYSCNNNKYMIIDPIDLEFNKQLLTAKGLDPNLFNPKEILQYYQISNYSDLSKKELELKFDEFIIQNYKFEDIRSTTDFSILFYKKKTMVNYSRYLYEAARDNQNGSITEFKENLVAKIKLTNLKENKEKKIVRKLICYYNDLVVINKEDTILFLK